jgi:hypothetical protein
MFHMTRATAPIFGGSEAAQRLSLYGGEARSARVVAEKLRGKIPENELL